MSTRATRSHTRKQSPASASSTTTKSVTTSQPRSKSTLKVQRSTPAPKKTSSQSRTQDVWCVCRGPDDGTPMIKCESCKDWFHFTCIDLSERDAEEIHLYVCDACHGRTGQSTVYEWEGPDVVEEFVEHRAEVMVHGANDSPAVMNAQNMKEEGTDTAVVEDLADDDDDGPEGEASGDDYKEEEQNDSVVVRRGRGTKRITSSDEELDDDDEPSSPRAPSRRAQLKRKRGREAHNVQRKRPRKPSSETGSDDDGQQDERQRKRGGSKKNKHDSVLDPTRKYCLGKLREVLLPIFVQFANAPQGSNSERPEDTASSELDEEHKKRAEEQGAAYVQDLEQCLFEIYGEVDKHSHKTAAGKYKDRFRMLTFNLSQPDRHHLRRSIGTHSLPALQLSKMSSVDLANEQTKQQIEAANRESLEHSILTQRPAAARAKITHKGEEIIEDLVGDDIGRRIHDEEQRDTEREREREKGARERTKMLPPPPPTPKEPSFKGPQDILAQQHDAASQKAAQIQAQAQHPAPVATSSLQDAATAEPSFKFDDLIAIDLPDDSPPQENTSFGSETKAPTSSAPFIHVKEDELVASTDDSASSSTVARSGSFDLKHVWSGAPSEHLPQGSSGSPILSARTDETRDPPSIDIDLGTAADDEDFDIFLDPETTPSVPSRSGPEAEKAVFEALPIVWSGNLNLPDTGKSPSVHARQVGGRYIENASTQWHMLFPAHPPHQLKVDGRVPVKESAKYMTQNRMNITRELIIVALTPSDNRTEYDDVISFLVNRDRHAVVHPWGPNPGPDAPGKELYLIPILPHQSLPDYVEILDLVKFPKQREDKMLLGVFVLNKGKFSERVPPITTQSSSAVGVARSDATPTTAGMLAPFTGPPSSNVSFAPASQAAQPTPNIPPEVVSKLTAEQIDALLQSVLSGGLNIPVTQPQTSAPSVPTTYHPVFPTSLANLLPQQYSSVPFPPFPPTGTRASSQYPQPPTQPPPPMPYSYTPPQLSSASPPRDQDYRSPPYSSGYGRPGRGDFDRPRRGGGRNFNTNERGRGAHGNDFDRPRDSGWGGRGRGRGGHQQRQSPPRPW